MILEGFIARPILGIKIRILRSEGILRAINPFARILRAFIKKIVPHPLRVGDIDLIPSPRRDAAYEVVFPKYIASINVSGSLIINAIPITCKSAATNPNERLWKNR